MRLNYIIRTPQIILPCALALYSLPVVGKPEVWPSILMLTGSVALIFPHIILPLGSSLLSLCSVATY